MKDAADDTTTADRSHAHMLRLNAIRENEAYASPETEWMHLSPAAGVERTLSAPDMNEDPVRARRLIPRFHAGNRL